MKFFKNEWVSESYTQTKKHSLGQTQNHLHNSIHSILMISTVAASTSSKTNEGWGNDTELMKVKENVDNRRVRVLNSFLWFYCYRHAFRKGKSTIKKIVVDHRDHWRVHCRKIRNSMKIGAHVIQLERVSWSTHKTVKVEKGILHSLHSGFLHPSYVETIGMWNLSLCQCLTLQTDVDELVWILDRRVS